MLSTGREVRMGKNCAPGLEYGPKLQAKGRTQDQGHSFFPIRTDLGPIYMVSGTRDNPPLELPWTR